MRHTIPAKLRKHGWIDTMRHLYQFLKTMNHFNNTEESWASREQSAAV